MEKSDVKLLGGRVSSFVNRVQIALNLKCIKYEFLIETFSPKSELLLKTNPVYKKIPVLIHKDKPICESLVIVEYIDEFWTSGPSILPSDPHDRATARFWAAYVDDKVAPLIRGLRTMNGEEKLRAESQFVEALVLVEGAFIESSKGHDFFGGKQIGYLDLALGCLLGWIKATEKLADLILWDENKTPNLLKWGEKFLAHDAVRDVIPKAEELVEFVMMMAKLPQAQSTK